MKISKVTKNAFLAVSIFGIGLYRLGAPYLEETGKMEEEAIKLGKEVQQVRLDAAQFDKAWEKKIEDTGRKVKARLPDKINSSEVLDYFVTQFDRQHPGTIAFQSATQSSLSSVSFGIAGSPNTQPRAARYRFEANMHQTMLIPYVEHMEKYNGLFKLNDFVFEVNTEKNQADSLHANLFFEFYLAPIDWVPEDRLAEMKKLEKSKTGAVATKEAEDTQEDNTFRQVFVSTPNAPASVPRAPAEVTHRLSSGGGGGGGGKLPKLEKIVGTSVISDENIFEEGDSIGSWKIIRVDSRAKSVTLKNGSTTKTVVVK